MRGTSARALCSARESLEDQTRTLTNFVSQGYAPSEQYTGKSNSQGPWTDIYALGAVGYFLAIIVLSIVKGLLFRGD